MATKYAEHLADPARRDPLKPEAVWEIERGLAMSAIDVHDASVERSAWFVALADLFEPLRRAGAALGPGLAVPGRVALAAARSPAGRWTPITAGWRWWCRCRWRACPASACPAGFGAAGLPMGLQLFGRRGDDVAILELGQAYHEATDWPRRRPA